MRIAIAGRTGFIGRHARRFFMERGDEVVLISRRKQPDSHELAENNMHPATFTWSELEQNRYFHLPRFINRNI